MKPFSVMWRFMILAILVLACDKTIAQSGDIKAPTSSGKYLGTSTDEVGKISATIGKLAGRIPVGNPEQRTKGDGQFIHWFKTDESQLDGDKPKFQVIYDVDEDSWEIIGITIVGASSEVQTIYQALFDPKFQLGKRFERKSADLTRGDEDVVMESGLSNGSIKIMMTPKARKAYEKKKAKEKASAYEEKVKAKASAAPISYSNYLGISVDDIPRVSEKIGKVIGLVPSAKIDQQSKGDGRFIHWFKDDWEFRVFYDFDEDTRKVLHIGIAGKRAQLLKIYETLFDEKFVPKSDGPLDATVNHGTEEAILRMGFDDGSIMIWPVENTGKKRKK
ncbi:hypothetical protein [Chitinophaga qingshengii]|uniref:Uncharacterized protein n=1 Tax=Chitinophaga qingshengii TaxID=1569794 RepID=A0ABR7TI89_9BACT|nr:hypothetical protein [Chitinophaga qingshengii]MBC9930154.1 hypothetical protein [Chitinophaga qingshengii]